MGQQRFHTGQKAPSVTVRCQYKELFSRTCFTAYTSTLCHLVNTVLPLFLSSPYIDPTVVTYCLLVYGRVQYECPYNSTVGKIFNFRSYDATCP